MTVADQYRVILTEDSYTTATEPLPRREAMSLFDHMTTGPGSTSVFRVVAEHEYRRIWPELERQNEMAEVRDA